MVDRVKLRQKIAFIEKNLRLLEELKSVPFEKFDRDSINFNAAVRVLQISIETMLDIANHIVARERLGVPNTYAESLDLLASGKVITPEYAARAKNMARFRNRAVHLYMDMNEKEVYNILRNDLDDFREFIQQVIARYFQHGIID
ncbi:MAG: type VII toxin-antitoxin system HepT family RNase toxin [Eubacteriales bacterium]